METSILGFIVLFAVWRTLKCLRNESFDPFLFIVLGLGMLVRTDFSILFIVFSLFVIIALPQHRKNNLLLASLIFFLIAISHTTFRWFYYNDIFPNTYYAKMTGVSSIIRMQRGLWVTTIFVKKMSYFLFALPFIYCFTHFRDKKIWLLFSIFLTQVFYSIYIGGDVWEHWGYFANRFLCIVIPLFFILISIISYNIINVLTTNINIPNTIKKCAYIILITIIIIQLHSGFKKDLIKNIICFKGLFIEIDKEIVLFGLKLKEITTPDAKITATWSGALSYYPDRFLIGILGKTDPFISHKKVNIKNYKGFIPGHNKWDYNHSIVKLKPDIVAQLWRKQEEIMPYLNEHYVKAKIDHHVIYCRKNSPNINWEKLKNIKH